MLHGRAQVPLLARACSDASLHSIALNVLSYTAPAVHSTLLDTCPYSVNAFHCVTMGYSQRNSVFKHHHTVKGCGSSD
jgi:hypothetical protein